MELGLFDRTNIPKAPAYALHPAYPGANYGPGPDGQDAPINPSMQIAQGVIPQNASQALPSGRGIINTNSFGGQYPMIPQAGPIAPAPTAPNNGITQGPWQGPAPQNQGPTTAGPPTADGLSQMAQDARIDAQRRIGQAYDQASAPIAKLQGLDPAKAQQMQNDAFSQPLIGANGQYQSAMDRSSGGGGLGGGAFQANQTSQADAGFAARRAYDTQGIDNTKYNTGIENLNIGNTREQSAQMAQIAAQDPTAQGAANALGALNTQQNWVQTQATNAANLSNANNSQAIWGTLTAVGQMLGSPLAQAAMAPIGAAVAGGISNHLKPATGQPNSTMPTSAPPAGQGFQSDGSQSASGSPTYGLASLKDPNDPNNPNQQRGLARYRGV
jgi:hypothetical protein